MRVAIVVFSKVPKAGETKTRLTTGREGILTPEEAMALYEGCVLDVLNACIAADCGDVMVCHNQGGDRQTMEKLLAGVAEPQKIKRVFSDIGGSFDDCMQYAGDFVLKHGEPERLADAIVIFGGDLPTLQPKVVKHAVDKLVELAGSSAGLAAANGKTPGIGAAIVEGACQEGGFSIIGYTCTTPFDFHRVFYNMDGITALDVVLEKAKGKNIPFACVEAVPDVDIPVDLAGMIPVVKSQKLSACFDSEVLPPANTLRVLEEIGLEATSPPHAR